MNKIMICLAVSILIMTSCKKDDPIKPGTIEVSPHSEWTSEGFKPGLNNPAYVIQFPENYEGVGLTVFEGPIFSKNRIDDKVSFYYGFCGSLFCSDYGDALAEPTPASINAKINSTAEVSLTSQTFFALNNKIIGILYYNEEDKATGRYFMLQGNEFLEALHIEFDFREYEEVESIIKTIQASLI